MEHSATSEFIMLVGLIIMGAIFGHIFVRWNIATYIPGKKQGVMCCQECGKDNFMYAIPIFPTLFKVRCSWCNNVMEYQVMLGGLVGAATGVLLHSLIDGIAGTWLGAIAILWAILLLYNAITDLLYGSIIPVTVISMFLLSCLARGLEDWKTTLIINGVVILIYLEIYFIQRSFLKNPGRHTFEVKQFGSADVLLLLSLANMFGLLSAAISLIYAVLILRGVQILVMSIGQTFETGNGFELYPYSVMGMAMQLMFMSLFH